MTKSIHPVASAHLPSFITAPSETDVLMVVSYENKSFEYSRISASVKKGERRRVACRNHGMDRW